MRLLYEAERLVEQDDIVVHDCTLRHTVASVSDSVHIRNRFALKLSLIA